MTRVSLAGGRVDELSDSQSVHRISEDPVRTWEKWWQWASERMNPILVKEVRQALKSRQFEVSFGLTLVAMVGWTLLFMSFAVPRIYYFPNGGTELLNGYAMILLVPLLIIIPFTAYRSLTAEVEESTFELLSITSLSAKQIVTGKMATAALQILLYVSALAPCIVLTYILRGVSLSSILIVLGATIVYSIMLVSCALMVATVARTRSGQSGMSVLLLAVLVISFFASVMTIASGEFLDIFIGALPREVSIWIFALVTVLLAAFSLMMQSAAAAIDFPSENKSTPIRKRILILLGTLLFWMTMLLASFASQGMPDVSEIAAGLLVPFYVVWLAVGALVCGERGIISPRARRTLPKSFLGRVMLTWLSPGAGLGYVFVVVVFASIAFYLCGLITYIGTLGRPVARLDQLMAIAYVLSCYVAIYVGLCRLCMLAIGRRGGAPMVVSFSLMVVVNLLLQVVPYYIASYWRDFGTVDFEWHQSLNVYLAITGILANGWPVFLGNLVFISLAALAVFGLNLVLSTRDVMILRIAAPRRVLQETQETQPPELELNDPFRMT